MRIDKNIIKCYITLLLFPILIGCSYKKYEAETEISAQRIKVSLVHNNQFLAEYKRSIEINSGNPIKFGQDTGGYSFVNIFETPDNIVMQTFHNQIIIIDKQSKAVALVARPLYESEIIGFVGKFDFDKSKGERVYTFVPKAADPKFAPTVMQGG